MARKTKTEIQEGWESKLRRALKKKQEWADQFHVAQAVDFYEGKQRPSGWSDDEWITVNKIYSFLQAQLPSLYSIDPFFYVKLKRSFSPNAEDIPAMQEKGKLRQAYLNYIKEEIKLKTTARLAIQDAHFGFGAVKIHYSADQTENPDAEQPILTDPDEDGNQGPMLDEDGEPLLQPKTLPSNERYNATRIDFDDLVWDESAQPLEDTWGWIAQRVLTTKDEARNDPNIKNSLLPDSPSRLDENDMGSDADPVTGETRDKKDIPFEFWEIYSLKSRKWMKICIGAEKPVMPWSDFPPGVEDHPYAILRFTLRKTGPYPIPPTSQSIDPQKEINLSRSQMMRHRKRFNRKYHAQGNWEDEELTKLEIGDDGTVIVGTGQITPIQDAPLDQSRFQELALLQNDLVEQMGSPDNSRQIASADSATEASLIDKGKEVREGDRLSTIVDWVQTIARKLDMLVQFHITRDEAIKVAGPSGENWEMVRATDYEPVAGEFEYKVEIGATRARLPHIERADFMGMLQVLASFPHVMTSERLMKRLFEMYQIDDDSMLAEIKKIGEGILQGLTPQPGGGSQSGVTENNPITQVLGAAFGAQGGTANGGGADTVQ